MQTSRRDLLKQRERVEKEKVKRESASKNAEDLSRQLEEEKEKNIKELRDLEALHKERLEDALSRNNSKAKTLTVVDMFKDVDLSSSDGPWKFNESTGSYSHPSGSYTTTTQADADELVRVGKEKLRLANEKKLEKKRKIAEDKARKDEKKLIAIREKIAKNEVQNAKRMRYTSPHSEEPRKNITVKEDGCMSGLCEVVKYKYEKLLITEKELVVALGICYRQLICSRIFCRYVTPYLFDKGTLDGFQLYQLFTRILPSYVEIFSGQEELVGKVLAGREDEAWNRHVGFQSFHTPYIFCELYGQGENPEDDCLNLCQECESSIVSHPPGACNFISEDVNSMVRAVSEKELGEWKTRADAWIKAYKPEY